MRSVNEGIGAKEKGEKTSCLAELFTDSSVILWFDASLGERGRGTSASGGAARAPARKKEKKVKVRRGTSGHYLEPFLAKRSNKLRDRTIT